jgi:hypothetical protein
MMEHPDDSAPATLRAGELIGKFHGEKAATGPIGWRCTVCCKPGPGRDHAAIEARMPAVASHSMTFMRWSIDRSCHCIQIGLCQEPNITPGVARHERPPEPISACDLLVDQSIAGRLRVRDYSCAVRPPQLAASFISDARRSAEHSPAFGSGGLGRRDRAGRLETTRYIKRGLWGGRSCDMMASFRVPRQKKRP